MQRKPRLLDLFCGAGGAAMGYARAGFEVVGVDIAPQPHYPFAFVQADALEYVNGFTDPLHRIDDAFDAIHASPPCQTFSFASMFNHAKERHPDLLGPTREILRSQRVPYVIENVMAAPMPNAIVLCGVMFDLGVFRHRQFESNQLLWQPNHIRHPNRATPMRKRAKWQEGEYLTVTGHFAYPLAQVQAAMGIDWMKHAEIAQAIPPAYTEWIGRQLLAAIERTSDAA